MLELRKNIIIKDPIKYFDFTASGLGYKQIEEKIFNILKTYANTHSEIAFNSKQTGIYYENARKSLSKSLELGSDFYIFPVGTGSTGAVKKFQELIGIYIPPVTKKKYSLKVLNKPLVIVGPFEHHSNEISYREGICDVIRCKLGKNGEIDLSYLEKILEDNKNKEIIGSFSVASNVTGIINPIKKISDLIRKYNGIMCLDAATSSAYMNVDSKLYDVMFLSPHKLLGGPGSSGILIFRKELYDSSCIPSFSGGGTVSYVSRVSQTYLKDVEAREDAGTPGILQFIRASLAYELRNEVGLEYIKNKEKELIIYFNNLISKIPGLIMYAGYRENKLAIFSFNVDGFSPYYISEQLSNIYNIQTRAGCSCSGPYGHDLLGIEDAASFSEKPGWLRVSLHYTHTKEDIDYFIDSLSKIISKGE